LVETVKLSNFKNEIVIKNKGIRNA